ncbi:hypothetical protein [Clostridium senegalense]|uniref:Uncharacterized protein n=1 Tax=Clostridium senegalense TaxID=1465809 RepID=A0A6M0H4L1_9CLOT|nr:hypothetical protein [Clostridium senegalense]NEU05174.1 hypothetical protein [Clostridium senegalense]
MGEKKKIITTQDFIEAYKKSVKFISVKINEEEFQIPINYSMDVLEEYQKKYELTNDYKEAFYAMTQKMIDNSRPIFDKEDIIANLSIDDIKKINDIDCHKIVEEIIEQSKILKKYYIATEETDFYKKFNIAILNEHKDFVEKNAQFITSIISANNKVKNMYKFPINSAMNNYLSSINNIKKLTNSYSNMNNVNSCTEIEGKKQHLNLHKISSVNPTFETNILLKDVTEKMNGLHEIQKEQVKANEQIASILLEEQKSNVIKEMKDKKNFIVTMVTNIIILAVAVLSFIGFDRVYKWISIYIIT